MTPEELAACEELINTPITPENVNQPLVPFFPKSEEKKENK